MRRRETGGRRGEACHRQRGGLPAEWARWLPNVVLTNAVQRRQNIFGRLRRSAIDDQHFIEFRRRAVGNTLKRCQQHFRRRIVNRIMEIIGWIAALSAVGVLFIVIISVLVRAWPALSWDFLTKPPALLPKNANPAPSRAAERD